jgi:hypothetical protein
VLKTRRRKGLGDQIAVSKYLDDEFVVWILYPLSTLFLQLIYLRSSRSLRQDMLISSVDTIADLLVGALCRRCCTSFSNAIAKLYLVAVHVTCGRKRDATYAGRI